MLQSTDVDVCIKDPGFPVDLVVHADVATLARWLLLSRYVRVLQPAHAG